MVYGASHSPQDRTPSPRQGDIPPIHLPVLSPGTPLTRQQSHELIVKINKTANSRLARFDEKPLGMSEIQKAVEELVHGGLTQEGAKAIRSLIRPYAVSRDALNNLFCVAKRFQDFHPTAKEWIEFRQDLTWRRLPEPWVLERHIGTLASFVMAVQGKAEVDRALHIGAQGATRKGRFEHYYRMAAELFEGKEASSHSFQFGEALYNYYRRSNCPPQIIGDILAARAKSDVPEFDRRAVDLLQVVDEGYPASRVLAFYNGYGVLLADNKAGTADFVLNVLEHSLRVGTPPRKVFERLMFGLCSGKKEEAFWEHKDTVFRRVVGAHLEEGLPIELLSNHILKRFVQFDRVSNPTVREELTERALAVVKAFSRILVRDSAEFRTDSEVATLQRELNKLFSKERMRYLLTRQDHFDKLMLVLSGSGLPPEAATMTPNRIYNTLTDLYTHAVLMDVLYSPSPEMRASARANFMSAEVANGDNPPFSLAATPEAQQARFQQQTEQVMHRGFDGYYGFAAMTFPFRRTPLTGACLVDDMANALSPKLNVVHAKDIHRFPGRGRYIEGIVPERVFFGAEGETTLAHWREKVLRYYGPVAGGTSQGDVHAIDDLVHTKFFFTRGATACLCPDNPFHTISGTHYSYLFFNHHFDAQDVRTAFLVPTEILLQLIEPSLEHYNPVVEPYPTGKFASDINDTPPLIETIREMCHHRGDLHGPIDLCWGSNFGGGLCNGFEPFSSPVHQWENEQYSFWDAFGHVHKWNIKRDPFILKSLHDAHQRIWEVATALQNRFDLYKIVEMQYLRGNTLDRKLGEEERFLQGGRTERVDVEELRNMDEEDQEIQARQLMENTHRMLEWVCRWSFECREKEIAREMRPVFVLQPALQLAAPRRSPIVIDTASRLIWHGGGKPEFFEDQGGEPSFDTRKLWNQIVYPHLARDPWLTGRFHFRDDFLPQMREYGAKE